MAPIPNPRVIFNKVPKDYPVPGETLVYQPDTESIDLDTVPLNGGVLIKILSLSIDPYLRGRMRDAEIPSYLPAFVLGKPVHGGGVMKVIRSEVEGIAAGDHLVIQFNIPWQLYSVLPSTFEGLLPVSESKIENPHNLPWSVFIGAAGMPGRTAFYSLREFADLGRGKKQGKQETIFVSTAAGTVGGFVVQLAKLAGLKVIGSTGSDSKVTYLKSELGVDVAFNYKTTSVWDILKEHGPIDIYFDNVGGEQLDAALQYASPIGSRFIVCGQMSEYNNEETYGIKNFFQVLAKRISINGFIQGDLVAKHGLQPFVDEYLPLIETGKIKFREDKTVGLENVTEALLKVLKGSNDGKGIVVVAKD